MILFPVTSHVEIFLDGIYIQHCTMNIQDLSVSFTIKLKKRPEPQGIMCAN